MAAPSKQVRLPFEKLTEQNLRPIIKKMEKWGLKVASVDVPNCACRESGFLLKDVTFIFEDGQKMLVRVKSDGTVFQVKLNKKVVPIRHVDDMDKAIIFEDGQKMLVRVKSDGTVFQVKLNKKVVPIRHVDDMDKAIIEMVDYVQENAKAYERAKLQRERRRKLHIDPPPVVTNRREKIERAKGQLAELTTSNEGLQAQISETEGTIQTKQSELDKAEAALKAERSKTAELERILAELEEV